MLICSSSAFTLCCVLASRKVSKRNTITVLDADKVQHKVRLEGIDAPESKQAFGTRSRQTLGEKVAGKEVLIRWESKDRYRRILGDVHLGERHINRGMVLDGFAWHFKQYSKSKALADAETEAREARRGLWADKARWPPWEFRKQQREKSKGETNHQKVLDKIAHSFEQTTDAILVSIGADIEKLRTLDSKDTDYGLEEKRLAKLFGTMDSVEKFSECTCELEDCRRK